MMKPPRPNPGVPDSGEACSSLAPPTVDGGWGGGAFPNPPRAQTSTDIPTVLLLGTAFGLLLALAWPLFRHWEREYTGFESYYAYGPAVPALVALLLWHRRAALRAAPIRPCYGALVPLLPAVALLVWSTALEMAFVMSLSFLLSVWLGVWLVLGTRWVRAAAVPLGFLLWMAPLPGPLLGDATYGSQRLCTVAAARLLALLSFHNAVTGSVIQLDSFTLFVDVPCSGLRNLLCLLMIGAACAFLLDGPPMRRAALFLASAPLSLAVNIARLVALGVVGECFGARAARAFHDWDGLLSLALAVAALLGLAGRLGCRTFAGWPLFSSSS